MRGADLGDRQRSAEPADLLAGAKPVQDKHGVGPEAQPGSDLAEVGGALEHASGNAGLPQRDRRRQSTDPGADDQHRVVDRAAPAGKMVHIARIRPAAARQAGDRGSREPGQRRAGHGTEGATGARTRFVELHPPFSGQYIGAKLKRHRTIHDGRRPRAAASLAASAQSPSYGAAKASTWPSGSSE
jgi:hypothetical protein